MKHSILLTNATILFTLPLCAAVTVVEDFESASIDDDIGDLTGWIDNTDSSLTMDIKADPADASNKVLRVNVSGALGSDTQGAYKALPTAIGTASTAATLFFQIRFENGSTNDRAFAGFSADGTTNTTNFDSAAAYAGGIVGGGGFGSRNGDTTESLGNPLADTWYNIWLVVDNSSETYDVYVNSGTSAATVGDRLWDDNAFRTTADGIPGSLDKIIVLATNNSTGNAYLDNFILDDAAANLNYQLVPEPSTYALLFGALASLLILRRRRS